MLDEVLYSFAYDDEVILCVLIARRDGEEKREEVCVEDILDISRVAIAKKIIYLSYGVWKGKVV